MNIHYNINTLPQFNKAVVTIGTFDGVHTGHKKILEQLKAEATLIDGETVVITFHPHPRNIVGDTSGVRLLTTLQEKIELLEKENINHLVVIPFDDEFSNLLADEYVSNFLYKKFLPNTLIIGYDHQFGKGRKGNYELLEEYGNRLGFVVKEIPKQVLQQSAVSSTRVRKALLHQDVVTATELLGYNYFFEGTIIKGDQIGRTIGYPTANIQINNEDKLVPGDGVYAVSVCVKNNKYKDLIFGGMMYIGSRPVVNGKRRVIEVNIFDFDDDIYDEIMCVNVVSYIRGDMNLAGLEALKTQLTIDKKDCINSLKLIAKS
ncbi:MAG: riboflavin biosynthesis protein RibF [Bacteroidetes bacterium]|nr:riboflavin biosynthesis protein RibF [Bacteroidota bacterium]